MSGEMKQRGHRWFKQRLGMVTASRFKDVLTQPRTKKDKEAGVMSATARSYLHECLTEMLINAPCGGFQSAATDWGTEWESTAFEKAAIVVEERLGEKVELPEGEFAFMQHQTEQGVGCSPDGIIGGDGLLEIKCPFNPKNHLATCLYGGMPDQHKAQVQGSLWVTGRVSYFFASFDPRYEGSVVDPLFLQRILRDDEYIDGELAPAVVAFRDKLQDEYGKIAKEMGAPF